MRLLGRVYILVDKKIDHQTSKRAKELLYLRCNSITPVGHIALVLVVLPGQLPAYSLGKSDITGSCLLCLTL